MKMNSELATLAQAEEDIDDDEDDNEKENSESGSDDGDCGGSEPCAFDVPHFPYIDDDVDEEDKERGWRNGAGHTLFSSIFEEDSYGSSSYRYVVVSGTPLKILEHLLSDLRLDDQRGAAENRESGKVSSMTNQCMLEKLTLRM